MAPQHNRRPGFSRRAQYGLFLGYVAAGFGALLGAVLLVISSFNPTAFAALRSGAAELTAPVSSGLAGIRRGLAAIPRSIGNHFRVMEENARLRAALKREHAFVQSARMLRIENARLRRLLAVRDIPVETVATARLVSSSASSTRRFGILNAGAWQGVRPGQPVRGPLGLIGRVVEVGPNSARILLVLDPESIIPVHRTRDGLPAIVSGRGDGMVDIRSAGPANAPFLRGDVFVTSGTGGIYPPNIPVARVIANASDTAVGAVFADPDSFDFASVQRVFMAPLPPPPRPAEAAPPVQPQEPR